MVVTKTIPEVERIYVDLIIVAVGISSNHYFKSDFMSFSLILKIGMMTMLLKN